MHNTARAGSLLRLAACIAASWSSLALWGCKSSGPVRSGAGDAAGAAPATSDVPAPSDAPPTPSAKPTPGVFQAEAMDAYLSSFGRFQGDVAKFSGYVLVAKDGKPIYSKGLCCADHARTVIPDHDTNVRLGSITKQFTATAIMLLAQEGKLATSDPIRAFLPAYPKVGRDITVHQLLTHTSGIPSYTDLPIFEQRAKAMSPDQLIATFADQPLKFPPGSKFEYSNSNYVVLAAIVEAVGKQSFAAFLQKRLFSPAGLTRTVVGDAVGIANRADGFTVDERGALVPAAPIDMSVPFGAGDVRSTAREIMTWFEFVSSGKLITSATWQRMTTVEKDQYAYGWIVAPLDGKQLITHGGGIDGFSTAFWAIPADGLMIFAWSNNDTMPAEPVARAAYRAFSGGEVGLVPEVKPAEVAAATVARYQGSYELDAASMEAATKAGVPADVVASLTTIKFSLLGKALRCEVTNQGASFVLTPTSDLTFVFARGGITVTFASGGALAHVVQGPLSLTYHKR